MTSTPIPASSEIINVPLSKPWVGEAEILQVTEVMRSGWLTQGPVVDRFERAVARYVGAGHGIAVTNGSAALHLALVASGVETGDEVIVPSLTFIATANTVRNMGAVPVFADVDPDSYNLSALSVQQALTQRTKAILAVHQFGAPADMDALGGIAQRHGCVVIEDAACALGSSYNGRMIGTHSNVVCFSFHPRKIITTGEGGMIVTSDDTMAARLRRLRHHGMDQSDWKRHQSDLAQRERYLETGYNYRMSDLSAAVGMAQMEKIETLIEARRHRTSVYNQAFVDHPGVCLCAHDDRSLPNGQTYALSLTDRACADREAVLSYLRKKGISARHGLACIHLEPCYSDHPQIQSLSCSEWLAERMILLPLFPEMTDAQQNRVIDSVREALSGVSVQRSQPFQHGYGPLGSPRGSAIPDTRSINLPSDLSPTGKGS